MTAVAHERAPANQPQAASAEAQASAMEAEGDVEKEPESDSELLERRYCEFEHEYEYKCRTGLRKFLQRTKGMSKREARAFVRAHFTIDIQECTFEDQGEVRSVEAIVTFSNIVPHKGADKGVTFRGQYSYRSSTGWDFVDHSAQLRYTAVGPTASTSASEQIFFARTHPGVEEANLELPRGHRVSYVEQRKFGLSARGAAALQAVCGPSWTAHEAVVMLYAAFNVPYRDKYFRCTSVTRPISRSGWLGHYTRGVCRAAAGGQLGPEKYEDDSYGDISDGYETSDPQKRIDDRVAEQRRHLGLDDDEDDGFR